MAFHCFFFFFFVFVFVLSPPFVYCSVTNSLPGFHGTLPFELETGYVGVGESEEVQLFYYFIKSERKPSEDPVLVWLTGGPGCSSFSGLALEIGPLKFELTEYNGTTPTLLPTPDSWTKSASIIFVDQPAGAGFSYSTTPRGYQASDTRSALLVDQFVRKWMLLHPEFISNPLYIAGDSYSGMIVPPTTLRISDGNDRGVQPRVNLKGYVLGNPLTNEETNHNAGIPYAHGMGLISDEIYESLVSSCKGNYHIVDPSNRECARALERYNECITGINLSMITDDACDADLPNPRPKCKTYYYTLSSYWSNDESVRRSLGIREGTIGEWVRCNGDNIPYNNDVISSFPYHVNLSMKGYRSLIYSGDHDMIVPHVATQEWVRALNYSIIDHWRPWMDRHQVQGYTRTYANQMTFATIKGGGHTAEFKRGPYGVMFNRWINGEPL
ncbi:PREDICTED: serine carboxypeptidase-like 1 [Tarenaya hassleriana]|uniref:serine carboxypeptidase-like 1 n=1 Tax=Tarenaya hassleriana TaxID=28532 RepID=UPI00053C768C|nr:PREDICTED: serine carboxypeptidase-like 1 [Tarenaya hassleriana]